jgi:purine-binding chemotaxis protein CheW
MNDQQLFLFARVAGTRIAIPSEEVEAVIRLADIAPIPCTGPGIAGLAARRSRVLTVIDVRPLVGEPQEPVDRPLALVVHSGGHSYAVMVESVRDICPADGGTHPLKGRISRRWRAHARAMVQHQGEVSLLVSAVDLIESGAFSAAA